MQIRLNDMDMSRVNLAKDYFSRLPVPVHMGNSDVVRVALRQLLEKIGGLDDKVAQSLEDMNKSALDGQASGAVLTFYGATRDEAERTRDMYFRDNPEEQKKYDEDPSLSVRLEIGKSP